MASTTRGKLKEEIEGMHSNLDWCRVHSEKCLILIQEKHSGLTGMFEGFRDEVTLMDALLQSVYETI